jgi:hypothetical protein
MREVGEAGDRGQGTGGGGHEGSRLKGQDLQKISLLGLLLARSTVPWLNGAQFSGRTLVSPIERRTSARQTYHS